MTHEEIIKELTPIVRKVFNDNSLILTDEMSANTLPAWTSLTFMKLVEKIEKQFGFKYKMMEILPLKNMGAIVESISSHTV